MPNYPTVIPAASALVVRDHRDSGIEVLLVKRASASRHFANLWVFPGGKVDATDRATAGLLARESPLGAYTEFAIATWRELIEETGADPAINCTPEQLRRVLPQLVRWAHWRAPQGSPQSFDTQFFLLDARALNHEPVPDGREVTELAWLSPAQAVEQFWDGRLAAAPPTGFNLLELAIAARTAGSCAALLQQESGRSICCIHPRLDRRTDPVHSCFPWDPDYEALAPQNSATRIEVPPRYRQLPSRLPLRENVFGKRLGD